MFYIILVFVKIVFFNMDAFTKRLITYQSEHQSMVHLFVCRQFNFFGRILFEVCMNLFWIYHVIVPLCHPENKQHFKFMVQFVTRRRDSLSMSGRYYHTYSIGNCSVVSCRSARVMSPSLSRDLRLPTV